MGDTSTSDELGTSYPSHVAGLGDQMPCQTGGLDALRIALRKYDLWGVLRVSTRLRCASRVRKSVGSEPDPNYPRDRHHLQEVAPSPGSFSAFTGWTRARQLNSTQATVGCAHPSANSTDLPKANRVDSAVAIGVCGPGAQGAVQQGRVAEAVPQLTFEATDWDKVLWGAGILVRGAGQGWKQPGGEVG